MKWLKKYAGYTLAWLTVPVVLATFMGMNFWGKTLVTATGVQVSPWFTGGEVKRSLSHGHYQTQVHRPIFDGLLWEKKEGFVQVDWTPTHALPARIEEAIDYNGDGTADFRVTWTKGMEEAELVPLSPAVTGLAGCYQLKNALAVRVNLRR